MSDADYTPEPEAEASVEFAGPDGAHHRAVHESPREARLRAVGVAEAQGGTADALSTPADCLPANNELKRWSPIRPADRLAVTQALACLSHPALLTAMGGPAPVQDAVRALGAAYAHVTRATLAGHLEVGIWLLSLRKLAPPGLWLRCFRDSREPFADPLPFSRQTAELFMRLAKDPAVRDPANWKHLPRGYTVVDAILRAAKRSGQSVQALVDNGTLYSALTRVNARVMNAKGRRVMRASSEDVRGTLREAIVKHVSALATEVDCASADVDGAFCELIDFLRGEADELERILREREENRRAMREDTTPLWRRGPADLPVARRDRRP